MTAAASTRTRIFDAEPLSEKLKALVIENPDVLLNDPDVMRALVSPAREAGRNVVDLRGALVDRLEQKLGELAEAHRDVVAAAWDNMTGMDQVHRAILTVLDARSFEEFLQIVADDFKKLLHVDVVKFCLGADAPEAGPQDQIAGDIIVNIAREDLDALAPAPRRSSSDDGFRSGGPVFLRSPATASPLIFSHDAARLRSEALIRLDFGAAIHPGLLAFGSEDANRFHEEQGADLLIFLGGVVERAMRDWLGLGR